MKFIKVVASSVVSSALLFGPVAHAFTRDTSAQTPQKVLDKTDLTISTKEGTANKFSVELAKTPLEQEKGEMFRTSIPEDGGMLFVWQFPRPVHMWMRNTIVPLDMVFIDSKGVITSIAENTIPYSEAVISSRGSVSYTLELPAGTTKKKNILVGDKVSCPALHLKG